MALAMLVLDPTQPNRARRLTPPRQPPHPDTGRVDRLLVHVDPRQSQTGRKGGEVDWSAFAPVAVVVDGKQVIGGVGLEVLEASNKGPDPLGDRISQAERVGDG